MAPRARSSDPRAERVRARLREAAFALAHEGPVHALTVGDIVARAGVSRQVYYQHFRDRAAVRTMVLAMVGLAAVVIAMIASYSGAFQADTAPHDGRGGRPPTDGRRDLRS